MGLRVANNPIDIPLGVEVTLDKNIFTAKKGSGVLVHKIHDLIRVDIEKNVLKISVTEEASDSSADSFAGTTRSIISNIIEGLDKGFARKLILIGVGYRVQLQGKKLVLSLGFSHPVEYSIPDGIKVELPSQTELIIKGIDKQLVGQVAAEIRGFRPPEPYKGKGVRYSDEQVIRKEGKKK